MLSAYPRVAALASPFRLVASLVLAAVLLAVPGQTRAGIMSLTVAPPSGPSGTAVTLSGSGAVPLATLRIFSEPWISGGHCGAVTEPQLVGEITAGESGTFQTSLRAVRSTSDVLGITFYAWDPDHQLPSNTACFTFQETPNARYFPETGHWVAHGFLAYWETFGGLPVFGYPITEEFQENGLTVQYFERARFEWHPGAWPERYDVLPGRVGAERLAGS